MTTVQNIPHHTTPTQYTADNEWLVIGWELLDDWMDRWITHTLL